MEMENKNSKLVEIMKQICADEGMQEIVDITIGGNPDRIYFKFENTMIDTHPAHGKAPYINTTYATMGEVHVMAEGYGLFRDGKISAKFGEGTQVGLAFKLDKSEDKK